MPASKRPSIESVLQTHRVFRDKEDFYQIVMRLFLTTKPYSTMTDEDLLFEPELAIGFCKLVRLKVSSPTLPYWLILRSLVASRKLGLRPPTARQRKKQESGQ